MISSYVLSCDAARLAAAQAVCSMGTCVVPAVEITDALTVAVWFPNGNTPDGLCTAEELLRAGNDFAPRASE